MAFPILRTHMKHLQADLDSLFRPSLAIPTVPPLPQGIPPSHFSRKSIKAIENCYKYYAVTYGSIELFYSTSSIATTTVARLSRWSPSRFIYQYIFDDVHAHYFTTREEAIAFMYLNNLGIHRYLDELPDVQSKFPEYFV